MYPDVYIACECTIEYNDQENCFDGKTREQKSSHVLIQLCDSLAARTAVCGDVSSIEYNIRYLHGCATTISRVDTPKYPPILFVEGFVSKIVPCIFTCLMAPPRRRQDSFRQQHAEEF